MDTNNTNNSVLLSITKEYENMIHKIVCSPKNMLEMKNIYIQKKMTNMNLLVNGGEAPKIRTQQTNDLIKLITSKGIISLDDIIKVLVN
jgi:hypothetical protein|tara:strand:- start:1684 stop:1950 length:267 start_codon:yes stop_codon:yes gene_type:complete